jgi:hypothetical protein
VLGSKPVHRRSRSLEGPMPRAGRGLALSLVLTMGSGCMSLAPQLRPTDYEELDTISDRSVREQAYADNAIYRHDEPQGARYTKGTSQTATKRSWQSLDAILRSDASSAAALPTREMRISRLFTALTVVAGILTVAGTAASAREGLDLQNLNGTGAVLLAGGLATVGFGITSGVFYGKTKKGYERAVDVYNDSLSVRLGLNTPSGEYIPPQGVILDKEGYILLDERERPLIEGEPEPEPETPPPGPELPPETTPPPAETTPPPAETTPPPAETTPPPAEAPPRPTVVVPNTPGGSAAAPYAEAGALDLLPR